MNIIWVVILYYIYMDFKEDDYHYEGATKNYGDWKGGNEGDKKEKKRGKIKEGEKTS